MLYLHIDFFHFLSSTWNLSNITLLFYLRDSSFPYSLKAVGVVLQENMEVYSFLQYQVFALLIELYSCVFLPSKYFVLMPSY